MPIENGKYKPYTEDEIYDRLQQNLENRLDTSADPGDLVREHLRSEAETIANTIEASLKNVYNSVAVESATGDDLDRLAELVGLNRNKAVAATGVAKFYRDTPPTSPFTIPVGTVLSSRPPNEAKFETTEQSSLTILDGWLAENFNNWQGTPTHYQINNDDSDFSTNSLSVPQSDTESLVYNGEFKIGTRFDITYKLEGSANARFRFGKDGDDYYEVEISDGNTIYIRDVVGGSNQSVVSSNNSDPVGKYHLEIDWQAYGDIRVTIYETQSKNTKLHTEFLGTPKRRNVGGFSIVSGGSGISKIIFKIGKISTTATSANIKAVEAGPEGNVGPNTIQDIMSAAPGIQSVINDVQTGNEKYLDTDFDSFVVGQSAENDVDLRERIYQNSSIGGAATKTAIASELRSLDSVHSVDIFYNRTENVVDGMPPHSFEAVVYGGNDEDVARKILETASIDSHDVGGINGTKVTHNVSNSSLERNVEMTFSRPTLIIPDIELDLVIGDNYIGDDNIRDEIVEYIGGTLTDGSFTRGLSSAEDIYNSLIINNVVDPEGVGVWSVSSISIDKDDDGSDDTTTLPNGSTVLEINSGEVAEINNPTSNITITTTQK